MNAIAKSGIGVMLLVGVATLGAGAQTAASSNTQSASSGQSLGEYARQIRKDPDTAKPKGKVFDNDNLPKDDKLSIVGTASAEPEAAPEQKPDETPTPADKAGADKSAGTPAAASSSSGTKSPEEEAKQAAWKQWGEKISSQQDQIDLMARELDVLQREYQLRAAAMYADAGSRLRNQTDWDKQDAQYKQQIADKQKALDDAKQKMDDLKEDARKAGVPNSVQDQASEQQQQPQQPAQQ